MMLRHTHTLYLSEQLRQCEQQALIQPGQSEDDLMLLAGTPTRQSRESQTMQLTIDLPEELATVNIAQRFAHHLTAPLVLGFNGEIGAGKTTFIRAMLRELGVQGGIKSPTYSLVESYSVKHLQCHHFDLYRIQDDAELEYLGFRDYFTPEAICCIEWTNRIQQEIPNIDLQLTLRPKGRGRELLINAQTSQGCCLLTALTGEG